MQLDDFGKDKHLSKSQRHIIAAFLELRASSPLEKISVVSLCEKADINKSTFYLYYHDIYELSDRLQEEVIRRIINSFDDAEAIVNNTAYFTKEILRFCRPDADVIRVLFEGSQSYKLPMLMERTIMDLFYKVKPQHKGDMKHAVMMSYKIYGAYYSYVAHPEFDPEERIEYIGALSDSFK